MKKLLKVCMILLTCCMANVFVCGTTNDISIVCAKDYGIENPKYRKGNTIWDTIYFGYYYQSQYDDTGIANNALKGCKDIKTLIIGSNMKKLGKMLFSIVRS